MNSLEWELALEQDEITEEVLEALDLLIRQGLVRVVHGEND